MDPKPEREGLNLNREKNPTSLMMVGKDFSIQLNANSTPLFSPESCESHQIAMHKGLKTRTLLTVTFPTRALGNPKPTTCLH